MRLSRVLVLALLLAYGCASRPAEPPLVVSGKLRVHDDLAFAMTKQSKLSEEPPLDRYEVRQVTEPIGPGRTLQVRLVTKILDERERAILQQKPDAIGEVWPNSLKLQPTSLVSHVTSRAWEATDFDPSGLAHEDFPGGHSTYRTPAKVTLHVAFIHSGALVVVHSTVELEQADPEPKEEQALIDKWRPKLERVFERLSR